MKTNKILTLFTILAISIAFTSCVQDDDYTVPASLGAEENEALTNMLATATEVDLDYVKALYNENGAETVPYYVEDDIYFKGYEYTSDKYGKLFKENFIKDAASEKKKKKKIILDQVDTYNQYNKLLGLKDNTPVTLCNFNVCLIFMKTSS